MGLSAMVMPTGAQAARRVTTRVVLNDPTGDVWASEEEGWVRAGKVPTADVTRAVVRHGPHNVVVTMTFADLRRVEAQHYIVSLFGPRRYGAVFLSAGPGRWRGHHELVDEEFASVKCRRLRHRIDYGTDHVSVTIPRTCIGRPAWVKVSMRNLIFRGGAGETDGREITDNPHSARAEAPLTRRVYKQRLTDRTRRTDATGDVTADDLSGDDPVLDPSWTNGDITLFSARHRHHRVTARLKLAELRRGPGELWVSHRFRFLTSRGGGFEVLGTVGLDGGGPQGVWRLSAGRNLRCRGLRHAIDYRANTVGISVPRSCLGRPRWVRVGAETSSYSEAQEMHRSDDALFNGQHASPEPPAPPDALPFGPRLRRG
jgi:hypothetical protein